MSVGRSKSKCQSKINIDQLFPFPTIRPAQQQAINHIIRSLTKGKRFIDYIHVGLMFSSCSGASNINEVLQPHEDFAMGLLNFRPRSIKL